MTAELDPTDVPVLLTAFNRPDLTEQVVQALGAARPRQLFIAADAPRSDRPGEVETCRAVRDVIENGVTWDCEVKTRFRPDHGGCRRNMSEGISWFFDQVPEGIVLEDDCVPHPTFFRYCSELLERFREDDRVFAISGSNLLGRYEIDSSYFFSLYGNVWGWASWRRAWQFFDADLKLWPKAKQDRLLESVIPSASERAAYENWIDRTYRRAIDTWDYQWAFARFINHGLTVLPRVNLVQNIGFERRGTHTRDPKNPYGDVPTAEMKFPLQHPELVAHDQHFRDLTNALVAAHANATVRGRARRLVKRALGRP
jgi:hypothetical protein